MTECTTRELRQAVVSTMRIRQLRLWTLLLVATVLFPSCGTAPPLTAADIVAQSARAMGGSDNHLPELSSLRFEAVTSGKPTTVWEIRRPNLVRKSREGAWILLFDGKRAGFLEGPQRPDGSFEGPHLVPQEDWHHFEMDIALYVPAFLEYPAAYVGDTTVEGSTAHLVRVTLPLGGVVVYAVDAASWLPVLVELPAWNYSEILSGFQEFQGITLPTRHLSPSDGVVTELTHVEVSPVLQDSRFVFPSSIQ